MSNFFIGAATASHQVEGDNFHNDIWAQEHMTYGGYPQKSGKAANHYVTYRDDIRKMKEAGLNAYRFSLEWSRIEPEEGVFDEKEIEHYRDMIHACRENGIEPIVTLFHFTSPLWLIRKGGWECDDIPAYFERYTEKVCEAYKDEELKYICTINEANIGVLIAKYIRMAMEAEQKSGALQVGVDVEKMAREAKAAEEENLSVFHHAQPAVFVSPRSAHGLEVVMKAHRLAVNAIHRLLPSCKAGLSLSVRDVQWTEDGKEKAAEIWEEEFGQFLPEILQDDYFGLQNYTRTIVNSEGEMPVEEGKEVTQMNYEFYPEGLGNVIRTVAGVYQKEILITENGIATADDTRRVEFIQKALKGVRECIQDGIHVSGYLYWSLIDNYEWQSGYSMQFGLMSMDEEHTIKPSMFVLGSLK